MEALPQQCCLCGANSRLVDSHVIPAFVFRWLKATGGTDYLRHGGAPNRRVQDGMKHKMLCEGCEQNLALKEKWYSEDVFPKFTSGSHPVGTYGPNYSYFVASLLWRVGISQKIRGSHIKMDSSVRERVEATLNCWKNFLLGGVANPASHELHAFPIAGLSELDHPKLPTNWNRYIQRHVETDYVYGEKRSFEAFYCKLGPVAYFGFVRNLGPKWVGSRISISEGRFFPSRLRLPPFLLNFFLDRAAGADAISRNISENQRQRTAREIEKNIDRMSTSDQFKAIVADAERFGIRAVTFPEDKE